MRPALFPTLLLLAACATQRDPVTGESYYSPLGNDYASQDAFIRQNLITQRLLAAEGGVLPEPQIQRACAEIFAQVADAVPPEHRRGYRYHFVLTTSPVVNAHTYGGGRVHCYLGLVAQCRDASELAAVLAHEIGHNSHDHIGQQMGRNTLTQRIFGLGGIGLPGQRIGQAVGGLVTAPVLVQHTRAAEKEADDRAVDYTSRAGFDPDGAARFFEEMEGGRKGIELLKTHPSPDNRVGRIRARIRELGGAPAGAVRDTPEFQAARERARAIVPYYAALNEALAADDEEAIEAAARKGMADLPHHAQFHFWFGILRETQGKRDEALPALRRAVALDRTNVLIPFAHSLVELDAGNYALAEASATHVVEIFPVLTAFLVRGSARLRQDKKEEAYADFDIVLDNLSRRDRRKLYADLRKEAPDYVYKEKADRT